MTLEGFHGECFHALLAGAYVNAVAATKAVEHIYLLYELHTGEWLADSVDSVVCAKRCFLHLLCVEKERTDSCVRTNVCTLVALDTVVGQPLGNECCHTTFLIFSSALGPCAIYAVNE